MTALKHKPHFGTFFFFLGIRISLEKKGTWKKKDQEIIAALQYKPQPQWKMGKNKYKPWLIMARVR